MKEVVFDDKSGLKKALEEKHTMQKVFHRHIVRYIDSFIAGGNKLYLIMEYCDKGDLQEYLKRIGVSAMPSHTKAKESVLSGYQASQRNVSVINSTSINFNASGNLMDLGEIRIWK